MREVSRTPFPLSIVTLIILFAEAAPSPPPFVLMWGEQGAGPGDFQYPMDMAFDSDRPRRARRGNLSWRWAILTAAMLALAALPAGARSLEIEEFHSTIEIAASGELRVEERIVADFRGSLFRAIQIPPGDGDLGHQVTCCQQLDRR